MPKAITLFYLMFSLPAAPATCYSSTMHERFDPGGGYHIVINGSPIMIRTIYNSPFSYTVKIKLIIDTVGIGSEVFVLTATGSYSRTQS